MDSRVVGDNYPFIVRMRRNGTSLDLTKGKALFKYKSNQNNLKTIVATSTSPEAGEAIFTPSINDFNEVGSFSYDLEYIEDGVTTTFEQGTFEILDSVETLKL
jgi:hypothetical protein